LHSATAFLMTIFSLLFPILHASLFLGGAQIYHNGCAKRAVPKVMRSLSKLYFWNGVLALLHAVNRLATIVFFSGVLFRIPSFMVLSLFFAHSCAIDDF
jgi:hypothetical protein